MQRRTYAWWMVLAALGCGFGCGDDGGSASDDDGGSSGAQDVGDGGGASGGQTNGGSDPGGGNSGGGSTEPDGPPADGVGKATFADYSTADNDAFLAGVAGEHDVVIYRVPAGSEGWLGKGKLVIERSGDAFGAKLIDAAGKTVSAFDSADSTNAQVTPAIGQVFGFKTPAVDAYLSISVTTDGLITGSAGGNGEVAFRNSVTAYGPKVPSLFRQFAGSYRGFAQALTCDQPPVTFTLSADGTAEVKGQYNLSCEETTVSATWDGNDDLVVPSALFPMGFDTQIDASKGGGSTAGGGITFYVNDWSDAGLLTYVASNGAGSVGNIVSPSLVEDGKSPTQDMFTLRWLEGAKAEVAITGDKTAPWDQGTNAFEIDKDGNLLFAKTTFLSSIATNVEGTTDQKTFRWQAAYMQLSLIFVELTFETDGSFVSGTYGGAGMGTIAPK